MTTWTVTEEPTTEEEGLRVGFCDGCGLEFRETVERLEAVPTAQPETEPVETSAQEQTPDRNGMDFLWIPAAIVVVILAAILLRPKRRGGKFEKK